MRGKIEQALALVDEVKVVLEEILSENQENNTDDLLPLTENVEEILGEHLAGLKTPTGEVPDDPGEE